MSFKNLFKKISGERKAVDKIEQTNDWLRPYFQYANNPYNPNLLTVYINTLDENIRIERKNKPKNKELLSQMVAAKKYLDSIYRKNKGKGEWDFYYKDFSNVTSVISGMLYRCISDKMQVTDYKVIERVKCNDSADNLSETELGGIIVFSNKIYSFYPGDVHLIGLYEDEIINDIKQWYTKWQEGASADKQTTDALTRQSIKSFTIGRFYHGTTGDSDYVEIFNERSLSLEITGINLITLISIAEDLCRYFKQEIIRIKSYKNEKVIDIIKKSDNNANNKH